MHTSGFEKPYPPPIIGAVEDGAAAVSEQNPLLGWAGLGWVKGWVPVAGDAVS